MTEEKQKFGHWCLVDIMGHQRFAGFCTEESLFGTVLLRVDVPETTHSKPFSSMFGGAAIYRITVVTEEVARAMAENFRQVPVHTWDLSGNTQKPMQRLMNYQIDDRASGDLEDEDDENY